MGKSNGCKNETLKRKAVFITGCDTGFGYSLILHNLNSSEDDTKGARIMIAGCYYPGGSSEGTYEYLIQHLEIMYYRKQWNFILKFQQQLFLNLGAESLKQRAKELGKEELLHIVRLDVTQDESVENAKVRFSHDLYNWVAGSFRN